jgi:hypothetical protein
MDITPADPQWLYDVSDLQDTPSSCDGITWEEEAYERATAVNLLVEVGTRLKV